MFLSVAVLFSRPTLIDEWVEHFNQLDLDKESTELVFLCDEVKPAMQKTLWEKFKDWPHKVIGCTYREPLPDVNIIKRRERITHNMNVLKDMVGKTQYVLGIEDDTLVPPNAFDNLYRIITGKKAAFASGVEVGRHYEPYIGAWRVDRIKDPQEIYSLPYKAGHVQEVDAAGLYCYMTPTRRFRKHVFRHADFGPDFYYSLAQRATSKCYVDWDVKCGHKNEKTGRVYYPSEDSISVRFKKEGDLFVKQETTFVKP